MVWRRSNQNKPLEGEEGGGGRERQEGQIGGRGKKEGERGREREREKKERLHTIVSTEKWTYVVHNI